MHHITGKQLFGLVSVFFAVAGILYYLQLLSARVIISLFWAYGIVIATPLIGKLVEGGTDTFLSIRRKLFSDVKTVIDEQPMEAKEHGNGKQKGI